MNQIDRNDSTPYYQQLAAILQEDIAHGRFAPNERLPTESDLCRIYDLSRSTVRETLRMLQDQRKIRMVPRRGAFVVDPFEGGWMLQVTGGSFEFGAEQSGHAVETRVLRGRFEVVPPEICRLLALPEGSRGFVLERVRWLDGAPVLHSTNWLPEEVGHRLEGRPVLRGDGSLNRTLREVGISFLAARRDVSAVPASQEVAEHLQLQPGSPVLLVESVSRGENDRPFDCYRSHVRSDRLKVSVEARALEDR
jgi:GntR family transcriptional regulator